MSMHCAIYAKFDATGTPSGLDRVASWLSKRSDAPAGTYQLRAHPAAAWVHVDVPSSERAWEAAASLARELDTEAILLLAETVTDAFAFAHYRGALELRRLEYGLVRERAWEATSGSPEAWEAAPAPITSGPLDVEEAAGRIAAAYALPGAKPLSYDRSEASRFVTVIDPVAGRGTIAVALFAVAFLLTPLAGRRFPWRGCSRAGSPSRRDSPRCSIACRRSGATAAPCSPRWRW